MFRLINKAAAPALGDVRTMGRGDVLIIVHDAPQRLDWPRYLDAIGQAITNGAEVRQLRRGQALREVTA